MPYLCKMIENERLTFDDERGTMNIKIIYENSGYLWAFMLKSIKHPGDSHRIRLSCPHPEGNS